jgi:hypothetical protein
MNRVNIDRINIDSIGETNQECLRIQIPLTPVLRKEHLAVLDVELNEFGQVCCLGYYRFGDPNITQFVFFDPISPIELAESDFFKYAILGSNRIVCYYADHERSLFNLPKDIMIETMSQPYFPKELAIKLTSLDMVSAKYLPMFSSSTAHNIACHNAGCIIKILLLLLGHNSFNRPNFIPKFQKFLSENVDGLDIGIPFTDLFMELDLTILEFILSPDKSLIEFACYFDFQTQFIRIVKLDIGFDEFMSCELWKQISKSKRVTSSNMDLLRCIIHAPESQYYTVKQSRFTKLEDFLTIKGLCNSLKSNSSSFANSDFDRVFYAYSQIVKTSLMFTIGSEFTSVHFKKNYYSVFRQSMNRSIPNHGKEVAVCRT